MADRPTFPPARERCIVVGAGISGLSAAFRLRQSGFDVTVLESTPHIGGKMSTLRRDGWTFNRAANILPGSYQAVAQLIEDVGLADTISEMPMRMGTLRDGTIHTLRGTGLGALTDGIRTDLLSTRSKLLLRRVAMDAARMRKTLSYANLGLASRHDTETAAEYCDRRLNAELRDYLVEPVVRALFTCNADQVSVVDFFFAAVNFIGSGLMRYTGGIDFLCCSIAEHVDLRTGAEVTSIHRSDDSVTVTWQENGTERTESVAGAILAVSGRHVPALYPQLDPTQRKIFEENLHYAATYVAHFATTFTPEQNAMLIQVPRLEDPNLCVVNLNHLLSPDCAPPGQGSISSFWLHDWNLEHSHLDDEALVGEMLPSLEAVIPGISSGIAFTHVDRWDPSVVRSYPGFYTHVARFAERIDPADRVQLAGDYLTASSTNGCAVSGEQAAARLTTAVFGQGRRVNIRQIFRFEETP